MKTSWKPLEKLGRHYKLAQKNLEQAFPEEESLNERIETSDLTNEL